MQVARPNLFLFKNSTTALPESTSVQTMLSSLKQQVVIISSY
jgi:hypothetical protein